MSGLTRRVLRSELLRSSAPVTAVATLIVSAFMMHWFATSSPRPFGFGDYNWPGHWMPLATAVRAVVWLLAAVTVAAGAWQASRNRRRRVRDQVASTARPAWRSLVVSWAAITLGAFVGLVVVVLIAGALVASVATYATPWWWMVLLVGLPALAATTALGFALGTIAPFRLTAPVVAVASLIAAWLTLFQQLDHWALGEWPLPAWKILTPVVPVGPGVGAYPRLSVSLWQLLWFVAVVIGVLMLVGARRKWLAVLPGALALVAAVPLLTLDGQLKTDRAASEPVCTDDEPVVCLPRTEAFALEDAAGVARDFLHRFDGVRGGPTRADGSDVSVQVDDVNLTGDVPRSGVGVQWAWPVTEHRCNERAWAGRTRQEIPNMLAVADAWGFDKPSAWPGQADRAYQTLRDLPEEAQKEWLGDFITALDSCDEPELNRLATGLAEQ